MNEKDRMIYSIHFEEEPDINEVIGYLEKGIEDRDYIGAGTKDEIVLKSSISGEELSGRRSSLQGRKDKKRRKEILGKEKYTQFRLANFVH